MINAIYECASTYLYSAARPLLPVQPKKEQKVEGIVDVNTGRKFSKELATKANPDKMDTCI